MIKKLAKGDYLDALLRSSQTIFSTKDVALLWQESNHAVVSDRLKKYAKSNKLLRVHRGLYAKDNFYSRLELATRIYTPAYISFETVLTRSGANFQYYGNIFVASYVSREIAAHDQKINFIRMKDYVLSDTTGITHESGVATATKERAFLDSLYVTRDYHVDNPNVLDWDRIFEIVPIYHSRRLEKTVDEYFLRYQENLSKK
jgi:hypothetical protein